MSLTEDQIAWLQRNRAMSGQSDDQSGDTSAGTGADDAGGATSAFDADGFYQQTLQSSGYTLGGDPCLDKCWADFQACLKTTNDPNQCLAQLTACQRGCGQQQQTSSGSGSTGDQPTTTAADTSGAADTGGSGGGSSTNDQSGDTSAGTGADNASGATPAFDADGFYQQTLQSSGYTLGGDPCLDKCWADFQACLKTTNDPNQCLAQLTACQRGCGQQQQTSSVSGSTGDQPTTTAADTSGAADTGGSGGGSSTNDQSGDTSAGTGADNASGATPAFDADGFYQQTLQSSGYTLGGDPCLDKCWADFQACLKTTNDPNQCLAQLTACQRGCGQQQQTSSVSREHGRSADDNRG